MTEKAMKEMIEEFEVFGPLVEGMIHVLFETSMDLAGVTDKGKRDRIRERAVAATELHFREHTLKELAKIKDRQK